MLRELHAARTPMLRDLECCANSNAARPRMLRELQCCANSNAARTPAGGDRRKTATETETVAKKAVSRASGSSQRSWTAKRHSRKGPVTSDSKSSATKEAEICEV
jgi:hypothetical protein